MARSRKRLAQVIMYDELAGEPTLTTKHPVTGADLKLTNDNNDKLVRELYSLTPEDEEMLGTKEGPDWTVVAIAHTPKATLVEWKSGNGHFASTTVIWL